MSRLLLLLPTMCKARTWPACSATEHHLIHSREHLHKRHCYISWHGREGLGNKVNSSHSQSSNYKILGCNCLKCKLRRLRRKTQNSLEAAEFCVVFDCSSTRLKAHLLCSDSCRNPTCSGGSGLCSIVFCQDSRGGSTAEFSSALPPESTIAFWLVGYF